MEFLAQVPPTLNPGDAIHLLNIGGVAGLVLAKNNLARSPTRLSFLGYLSTLGGKKENIREYALTCRTEKPLPLVVMVVGSDMEVGKTTTAAAAIHQLTLSGHKTGGAKLTGTSRMKDLFIMRDAGAEPTLDFVDFGVPATYGTSKDFLLKVFNGMRTFFAEKDCQYMVMEVADGIFQPETQAVLENKKIMSQVSVLLFSAADSVGAYGGCEVLRRMGYPPDFVSGLVTASKLKTKEVAAHCPVPLFHATPHQQEDFLEVVRRARPCATTNHEESPSERQHSEQPAQRA
jgi:hypothetical protein